MADYDNRISNIPPVVALHRYFMWANKMRADFDDLLQNQKSGIPSAMAHEIEMQLYMSYWYAGLYVVIEGWQELQLVEPRLQALLNQTDFVGLLRRYRNGVFHFQKDYFDQRFADVWLQKQDFISWIRSLNSEFGRFFLEWYANYDVANGSGVK